MLKSYPSSILKLELREKISSFKNTFQRKIQESYSYEKFQRNGDWCRYRILDVWRSGTPPMLQQCTLELG